MYLTGLTHRRRVFEIASRWLGGRVQPEDGRFITEVFIFESLISGATVQGFINNVLRSVHEGEIRARRVRSKDDVRQAIVEGCPGNGPRVDELFRDFRDHPEEFFPRTPVDLLLSSTDGGTLVGMTRLKRIRRIAEKASRRLADHLQAEIQWAAEELARRRAESLGIELAQLISSDEEMERDFAAAERIVANGFRDHGPVLDPQRHRIDDVIGTKFIGDEEQLERIERAVNNHADARLVEREEHRGAYNAVNLLVDLQLPPASAVIDATFEQSFAAAALRGLHPEILAAEFPAYVESGARSVRLEVILTTPQELVESEFGRAIHEERILEQRCQATYCGRIAHNASFLIEYLLKTALSPTTEITELPVKLWGRYLPDSYSAAVWRLFGAAAEEGVAGSFVYQLEVPSGD